MAYSPSSIVGREFQAFWNAGLRGQYYTDQSAVVCFLDLNQEEVTLTRSFFCTADDGNERAEDNLIDWFYEEQLIQKFDNISIHLYMNYSPLKLTVDGLLTVCNNLRAMGKQVKMRLKFAELYKTRDGEEDAEENRQGLRQLNKYGVEMNVLKERDWLYLLQTLTQKSAKKQQAEANATLGSDCIRS